jgi:hypothetical protein
MAVARPHEIRHWRCGDGNRARAWPVRRYAARRVAPCTASPRPSSSPVSTGASVPCGVRLMVEAGLIQGAADAAGSRVTSTRSKCCVAFRTRCSGRPRRAGGPQNTGLNCPASRTGRHQLSVVRPPAWRAILEMPAATMVIGTLARSCSRGRSRGPHVEITSSTVQPSPSANTRLSRRLDRRLP